MQDRYAGDVGDYIKLALLREIAPVGSLGVIWYLFPDEAHNADGRHTTYLDAPEGWRHLDPELFDTLKDILSKRTVAALEQSNILPNARYVSRCVDSSAVEPRDRDAWRRQWFAGALASVDGCPVVFADPDNGLVSDAPARRRQKRFGKQVPVGEAKAIAQNRTAVIYHHNTRYPGGHDLEVDHWRNELGDGTIAVRANAYSCRTFFIVNPTPEIRSRTERFCERWKDHRVRLDAL